MDNLFGKTFKHLRLMKNVEAKSIACDGLSYSQLMRFEAGKTSLTVEKLMLALHAIGTNFVEFEYAYYELAESDLLIGRDIWQSYWQRNIAKLELLIDQLEQKIQAKPDDFNYLLYKVQAEAFLKQLQPSYLPPQEDIKKIVQYLLTINQWWYTECELLMNSASIFSDKQLRDLTHKMLNPEIKFRNSDALQMKIDAALLSVIRVLIANKHFDPLHEIFDYLDAHVLPDYNMYERAMFAYFKTLYRFRKAPSKETLAPVERCIEAFKILDCFGLANYAADEVKRYCKESHI